MKTPEPPKPKDCPEEPTTIKESTSAFEQALSEKGGAHYVLRLYLAGSTPKSQQALSTIRQICNEELAGRYDLEVIDIYQDEERATADNILAVPTLLKELPSPLRRLVGDLSDRERVLVGLNLREK